MPEQKPLGKWVSTVGVNGHRGFDFVPLDTEEEDDNA